MSLKRFLLAAATLAAAAAALPAIAAQKRLYIAPDDHTDYVWTSDEATYAEYFPRALDEYLSQIAATATDPNPDQRAKWNVDGTFWLQTYERARPAAAFDLLMRRVKDGSIGTPLNTLVSVHGGTPVEGVLRDMYYAGRLERRFNFRIPLAIDMENHVASYGLSSLMAGAGAKYRWKGVCEGQFDGCSNVDAAGDRAADAFYQLGPDGSRLLTKWMSLHPKLPSADDSNQGPGGYAEARHLREAIPFLIDGSANFRARWPYDVIGLFGAGWDDPEYIVPLGDARNFRRVAQDLTRPDLRIILSNENDFFADFEATYGAGLPTQAASFGNEWEVNTAAFAAKTGRVKRAIEKLRAAEAMASVVSIRNPAFMTGRDRAREDAFTSMGLYYEHNAGGGGNFSSQQRADFQERQAALIEAYVNALHADAATAMGALIPAAPGAQRLYAFNPLGFTRTDVVESALPGSGAVHVVEVATGRGVAAETIGDGAARRLRWIATSLPSFGYKVYEVRAGIGPTSFSAAASFSAGVLSSSKYRVTLDASGRLTSLIDRANANRETIDLAAGAANALNVGEAGTVSLERSGPVSATLLATGGGAWPRTTRVTLYRGISRVEIDNRIDRGFDEVLGYRFAFNTPQPLVHHGEVGAVIKARLEPDGQYSARGQNAVYEWLTLNHFVHMSAGAGTAGVTLSAADTSFFRLGNSTLRTLDTITPTIEVLAGGRANGARSPGPSTTTSILTNQGGDTRFRFAFALQPTAAYSRKGSLRMALEHQNPVVAGAVTGPAAAPLPATTWSLIRVSSSDLYLWAVKPSEEGIGQGLIARVWNQSDRPLSFTPTLGSPSRAAATVRATHIETDLPDQTAARTVKGNQIATFRLKLD